MEQSIGMRTVQYVHVQYTQRYVHVVHDHNTMQTRVSSFVITYKNLLYILVFSTGPRAQTPISTCH